MPPRHRALKLPAQLLVPLLMVGTLPVAGCKGALEAGGSSEPEARANLSGAAAALEARYTNLERVPRFANARMRMGRYAFAPSKLVNDTSIWTTMQSTSTGAVRTLEISGEPLAKSYLVGGAVTSNALNKLGSQVHKITLTQKAPSDWLWNTSVKQSVGSIPPESAKHILKALFATANRTPAAWRADYHEATPHTAKALSDVVTLDSINTVAMGDGSSQITMVARITGERLRDSLPAFAAFVNKYMGSTRWLLTLTDERGAQWFKVGAESGYLRILFRTSNGSLQPLYGSARTTPDMFVVTIEAAARKRLFTAGVSNLKGSLLHVDSPSEQAWELRFTTNPEWQLPLGAERLIRAPLRYMFEGRGLVFRFGLRREANGQTVLERSLELPVQESAVMRFLGDLGFTAMSDFAGQVEKEENRFLAGVFGSFRQDLKALGAR